MHRIHECLPAKRNIRPTPPLAKDDASASARIRTNSERVRATEAESDEPSCPGRSIPPREYVRSPRRDVSRRDTDHLRGCQVSPWSCAVEEEARASSIRSSEWRRLRARPVRPFLVRGWRTRDTLRRVDPLRALARSVHLPIMWQRALTGAQHDEEGWGSRDETSLRPRCRHRVALALDRMAARSGRGRRRAMARCIGLRAARRARTDDRRGLAR